MSTSSSDPPSLKRVKTGCITCRIRRVKCDEAHPDCNRCTSTGRKCDGYSSLPFSRRDLHAASTTSNPTSTKRKLPPAQLSLLPRLITDPAFSDVLEKRYFQFFRQKTVESTNSLIDSRFWDRVVLQACHLEPAIKHAVLALSSLHQLSELPDGSEIKRQHQAYAEKQHHKALETARKLVACATPQDSDRVLIACIIFICYESVRGDYAATHIHMHSGHRILAQNRQRSQQASRRNDLSEIQQAFLRLDIPAITFQDGVSPMLLTLDDYICTRADLVVPELETIAEARDSLMDSLRWLMIAANAAGDTAQPDDRCQDELAKCALQIRTWRHRFEHLVREKPDSAQSRLVVTLRMWSISATAIIEAACLGPQSGWDTVEHLFGEVVSLAEEIASPSFSVEIGYIGPLFLAATRCRDPGIRRHAIHILRAYPRQEGLWESTAAAAVAERWCEVEEGGLLRVEQASDIPEHMRVYKVDTAIDIDSRSASLQFWTININSEHVCRDERVYWQHPSSGIRHL